MQPARLPVQLSGRKTNARARYKNYNLSSTRAVKCLLAQIFCDPKSRLKPCLVLMPASCRASLLLSVKKMRARRRQLPRACQRSARCFFAVAKRRSCLAPAYTHNQGSRLLIAKKQAFDSALVGTKKIVS